MLQLAALEFALMAALMALLYGVGRRLANMAVVDVGWTFGIGLLGALDAALGTAPAPRRLLVAAMAIFWSARLGLHLLRERVLGQEEEGRYRDLRSRWGTAANRRFFWFFQAQGALDVLLATPFLLAANHVGPFPHPLEVAAAALLAVSVLGEGLADRQLRRFRADPAHRGQTCRAGLWRTSRHPNYFFEWLVWCAFALLALPAPLGAVALLCPALMLWLVLKVTGIPPTEEQALRSRGDDYRRYQKTTSAFVPWFPRSAP